MGTSIWRPVHKPRDLNHFCWVDEYTVLKGGFRKDVPPMTEKRIDSVEFERSSEAEP